MTSSTLQLADEKSDGSVMNLELCETKRGKSHGTDSSSTGLPARGRRRR